MQTTEEVRLVCPECRRENEAERVYCHDCGARLDRTKVAKLKAQEDDPKETQRRLKAMFDQHSALRRKRIFDFLKLVLVAWLVAGVVQIVRPPDMSQHATTSVAELPPQINMDLENAATDSRITTLPYSEDQVNAYLTYALRSKQTMLSKYFKFERLGVGFNEGAVRLTAERSLYGYSVFTTGIYSVKVENGNVIFKNLGGQIGRLQLHPMLMRYSDFLLADLRTALERERKLVGKMSAVELHPKQVVFVPRQPQM